MRQRLSDDVSPLTGTGHTDREQRPFRSYAGRDVLMRRLLRVTQAESAAAEGAYRTLQGSLLISAARCLLTYLVVPLVVPLMSFAGVVVTPVSMILCSAAIVSCVLSLRRFWIADHTHRWRYGAFITAALFLLVTAIALDVMRLAR